MSVKRKKLNLLLLAISVLMGVWAACLYRRPPLVLPPAGVADTGSASAKNDSDSIAVQSPPEPLVTATVPDTATSLPVQTVRTTNFSDVEPSTLAADNPFRAEAARVLSGRLEETDSISRRKILSYCEHLRTSYTTRDIDFIRQVFSDNALIIVGHVVRTGERPGAAVSNNSKVIYNLRSKREYIEKLSRIFDSGKAVDVDFSEFRIMRHPTVRGLYGVTLRQKYSCGTYSDDGYLFLLWDFRNMSMPLIHVRTWQPSLSENPDEDDIIGIGDFNLE